MVSVRNTGTSSNSNSNSNSHSIRKEKYGINTNLVTGVLPKLFVPIFPGLLLLYVFFLYSTRNIFTTTQEFLFQKTIATNSIVTFTVPNDWSSTKRMNYENEKKDSLSYLYSSTSNKNDKNNNNNNNNNSLDKNKLNFQRKLLFFHIPKTAGTAIEHAAAAAVDPSTGTKHVWGSCVFNHKRKRSDCVYPDGGEWPEHIGWWHIPTHFFPLSRINPYQGGELFGVIRHPFDRMVSEFYYICTLKVFEWRPDQCDRSQLFDPNYMNTWISNKMKQQKRDTGSAYLMDNGHFTPQYDFIFGPNNVRMLDYVLTMDDPNLSLADQFNQLMDAFGMSDVRLVKFNALGAEDRDSDTHLDVRHLNNNTIRSIHTLYADDFSLVHYDKEVNK